MTDHTTNESTNEIPYGYCHCGCGQKTKIATQSHTRSGQVRGQPMTYLKGHHIRVLSHERVAENPGPNPSGLCMCGCGQAAPIAKSSDKTRGIVRGKPIRFIQGHQGRVNNFPSATERFWAKVDKQSPEECWLWTASTYQNGYGQLGIEHGNHTSAHRFSYEIHYGKIPNGRVVMHTCDNPRCVNPAHLKLGTQQDNVGDMHQKRRNRQPKGERQRSAKLTETQVLQVRTLYDQGGYTFVQLAQMMNVTTTAIREIVRRNTWKHI